MDKTTDEMARDCFGYGRWEAPYWFIGPEQGQAHEEGGNLNHRVGAWSELGGRELNDCREFHDLIREQKWHRPRPRLQPTWRRLMLVLMSFLERSTDRENLRNYQRDQWGRQNGETCVIELSGLPAHSFKVARDRDRFRQHRLVVIIQRLREYRPQLVLMYGQAHKVEWERICGHRIDPGCFTRQQNTMFAFTPHPVSYSLKDAYWTDLGSRLREFDDISKRH